MPIYEYECEACQHELERLQKISDPVLTDCPECGKPSLRRKISAAGFRLKGGGWYETDFKSGNKKNIAGDNNASSSSTSAPTSSDSSKSSSSSSSSSDSAKAS